MLEGDLLERGSPKVLRRAAPEILGLFQQKSRQSRSRRDANPPTHSKMTLTGHGPRFLAALHPTIWCWTKNRC
jgi:hypothetical protein